MKFNTITAILMLASLLFSLNTLADDVSDVMKVVNSMATWKMTSPYKQN